MKYLTISKFAERSGYSEKAIRNKIERNVWIEKMHYIKSPDGRIQINTNAIELWMEAD